MSFQANVNGQVVPVTVPQGAVAGTSLQIPIPPQQPVLQGGGIAIVSNPYGTHMPGMPGMGPPPGAPAGGQWVPDQYCGIITILIAIFLVPCVCCCPCDTRSVYLA